MRAVIMAGGKGTRLTSVTRDIIPKPLAEINGRSILAWQIECLKQNGITEICIVTGYLGDKIRNALGAGEALGVTLRYYNEAAPLGTAGALAYLEPFVGGEAFVLAYGDCIFDVDISRMAGFHYKHNALVTLFAHPNSHPYDSDLLQLDEQGRVVAFFAKDTKAEAGVWRGNTVNAGLYIMAGDVCKMIPKGGQRFDLEKELLLPRIKSGGDIFAYTSSEYVKDAGTPKRLAQAEADIKAGVIKARNLNLPQKCIFLDRDGTINIHKGLIYRPDDLELLPGAADAVRIINTSGFLCVIVTNQPVISRGLCDIKTLDVIHQKLATLLGNEGAYTDALYYCPHHPDKGFPEEIPEYKIPCDCRKPGIAMIQQAIAKFNIKPELSWIVGDNISDIKAGINAGIKTALVMTGVTKKGDTLEVTPDIVCEDLPAAIRRIIAQ